MFCVYFDLFRSRIIENDGYHFLLSHISEFSNFVLLLALRVLCPYVYSLKLETSIARFSDSDVSQSITIQRAIKK